MSRKRAVIFISGSGSNMAALIASAKAHDYPVEFIGVISDNAGAGGIGKAEEAGVPAFVFERKNYASKMTHEQAILAKLAELRPDVLCLAGYMRLLSPAFIAPYEGRILNIHPSLLPLFAGLHTHQRAIDAGMKISGCTVHIVTAGMDEGPILAQAAVPILNGDTAETLAARVLVAEHKLYSEALGNFAGRSAMTDSSAKLLSHG